MVRINRLKEYTNSWRSYQVVLDGDVVGELKDGQQIEFDVNPGQHSLCLKIDWCRSNVVNFRVWRHDVEFECGCNLDKSSVLQALIYITSMRTNYLWLKLKPTHVGVQGGQFPQKFGET